MGSMKHFVTLLLLLTTFIANAQRSLGGFPLPAELKGSSLRHSLDNRVVEMPPFDMDSLKKDSLSLKVGGYRFAYGFTTDLTPANSGETTYLPDGTKVWRVEIHSEDARSINLIFNRYRLSKGARVFLYSPDRQQILGAFTEENNHESGILATTPIEGDRIVVEYIEPKDSKGDISIGKVNHGFKDLRSLPSFNVSAECEVNVNCTDAPSIAKRSSVLVTICGEILCSGSLINNASFDGTPYLLSAAHCLNNYSSRMNANEIAATCVFYFNYEVPYCNMKDVQGSLEMSLSGASVVDMVKASDLLLMQLDEMPPVEYNPYFAGWNINNSIDKQVYTIHHPEGDVAKYNLSKSSPIASSFLCCDDFTFDSNSHWEVDGWEIGITEGGSSGAPLFDINNRIIGALSGGYNPSGCEHNNRDLFYRLNKVWNSRNNKVALSTWLDPNGSKKNEIDGWEPYKTPCERVSNYDIEDQLHSSMKKEYAAGTNSHQITEYAEKFEKTGTIYGVHFIPEVGTYQEKDTIWMKIYEGDQFPEKLIYKQRIRITDISYEYSKRKHIVEEQNLFTARDNYLHFDQPVVVKNNFFVVYEIPSSSDYPFAIYAVDRSGTEKNTAYFKANGEWQPFGKNPVFASNTSLMLEPRMQVGIYSGVKDEKCHNNQTTIYPNPTKGEVSISAPERIEEVALMNTNGQLYSSYKAAGTSYTLNLANYPKGVYLLKIIYSNKTEVVKLIKE